MSYIANIPIIQRLIETIGFTEHGSHKNNRTYISIVQWLIKVKGFVEHATHGTNFTNIPLI
jgi:hypothetical protein